MNLSNEFNNKDTIKSDDRTTHTVIIKSSINFGNKEGVLSNTGVRYANVVSECSVDLMGFGFAKLKFKADTLDDKIDFISRLVTFGSITDMSILKSSHEFGEEFIEVIFDGKTVEVAEDEDTDSTSLLSTYLKFR